MKRLGFTLIELLAVIVILGVIMLIAIPSVTNYITGARSDSYISTVQELIQGVRNSAVTEDLLPTYPGQGRIFNLHSLSLEKGGTKSPFGKEWDKDYWYVIIVAGEASESGSPNYYYFYQGNDASGNYVPLTEESKLTKKSVSNAGSNATARKNMDNMIEGYSVAESTSPNAGNLMRDFKFKDDGFNIKAGSPAEENIASITTINKYLSNNNSDFNDLRFICFSFVDVTDSNKSKLGEIGNYDGPTDCAGKTNGPYIKIYYSS